MVKIKVKSEETGKKFVDRYGIERVKSGVKGLDSLISGGFVRGNTILICGNPGTGKTIFGMQYLYSGVKDHGENGVFVSIEDYPDKLNLYGRTFGWNIQKYVDEGKLSILQIPIDQKGYNLIQAIEREVKRVGAKRVVVDSLSALNFNASMFSLPLVNQPDPTGVIPRRKILKVAGFAPFEEIKQFTYLFLRRLADISVTTIVITDSPDGPEVLTYDGVSEFVCDGVLQVSLHDTSQNISRTLAVKKMRGGSIVPGMKSLKFTKGGLEIGEYKVYY